MQLYHDVIIIGAGLAGLRAAVELAGSADIAVHSMKDVPMAFPAGLDLGVICAREEPSDAFVSNRYPTLDAVFPHA